MSMDADTITLIIGAIVTALGGGVAGGRYLFTKQNGSESQSPIPSPIPSTVNTGQVPKLDLVTGPECRATRKEITDSIARISEKTGDAFGRQADKLNLVAQTVTRLEAKLDGLPAQIENATIRKVQGHENRCHRRRPTPDEFERKG